MNRGRRSQRFLVSKYTTAYVEVGVFDSGTGHDEKSVDIGTAFPREGDPLASDLTWSALKVGIGEAAVDEAVCFRKTESDSGARVTQTTWFASPRTITDSQRAWGSGGGVIEPATINSCDRYG